MAVIIAVLIMLYFEFTSTYLVLTNGDTGEVLGKFPYAQGIVSPFHLFIL